MVDIIRTGNIVSLTIAVFLFLVIIYVFWAAKKKDKPFGTMRPITAMEHIEEAVGRAAEMNKSVFFCTGDGTITTTEAINILAGISVLGRVAEITAKYNVPLTNIVNDAYKNELERATMRDGYIKAGHLDRFKDEFIEFPGGQYFAWSNAAAQYLLNEQPGAAFLIGRYLGAAVLIGESCARSGALSFGGGHLFFVISCDYFVLGEELFACGAYASGDKDQLASIAGTDIGKTLALILLLLGIIMNYAGNKFILSLLSM